MTAIREGERKRDEKVIKQKDRDREIDQHCNW